MSTTHSSEAQSSLAIPPLTWRQRYQAWRERRFMRQAALRGLPQMAQALSASIREIQAVQQQQRQLIMVNSSNAKAFKQQGLMLVDMMHRIVALEECYIRSGKLKGAMLGSAYRRAKEAFEAKLGEVGAGGQTPVAAEESADDADTRTEVAG